MTTLADRSIDAIRSTHERLVEQVRGLTDQDLSRPSGAREWTVAQVLSHLGSGAELTSGTLRRAQDDQEPALEAEQVWARWDAMTPREQADGFLRADTDLADAFDALDDATRRSLSADLGFLPEPVGLDVVSGMRLNEAVLHAWDVEVAFDPAARIPTGIAEVLLEQYRGPLGFLLGFAARPDQLGRPATLAVRCTEPAVTLGLALGDRAGLVDAPDAPDGALELPLESFLRLLSGRLTEPYTPAAVAVSGSVSLDELRRVFPGY